MLPPFPTAPANCNAAIFVLSPGPGSAPTDRNSQEILAPRTKTGGNFRGANEHGLKINAKRQDFVS
jgi:hypothetical protein